MPSSSGTSAPHPDPLGPTGIGWAEQQLRARDRYWPAFEAFLGTLPESLFRQVQLVQYDLALRHSESGAFHDSFMGAGQFPLLSLHSWLLEDLGVPEGAPRDDAERKLFLVAALFALRTHTLAGIADRASFYDAHHIALAELCAERAVGELAGLPPPGARFWAQSDAIALDELDWMAGSRERSADPAEAADAMDTDTLLRGRWSAPARRLALAALEVARRTGGRNGAIDDVRLCAAVDALARADQLRAELESMHADLQRGHVSHPIAYVAAEAGIPLRPAPLPEQVLGALALTGATAALLGQACELAREARLAAEELELPTFAAYLRDAEDDLGRSAARAAGRPDGTDGSRRNVPLVRISPPPSAKALDMAERFLLSERQFRESWEMHREGMFGSDEVASRFPAGLVLEILRRQGHDVSAEIEDFLTHCVGNRFRYYDHPWSDADADTLGVYLRLRDHTYVQPAHEQQLGAVLARLDEEVAERGHVPVWIPGHADVPADRPPILALGEGCGTVAAHLLLGLVCVPSWGESHGHSLTVGATALLRRVAEVGLGANVAYPPGYALGVFFRLVDALRTAQPAGSLGEAAAGARRRLEAELDALVARRQASPQSAALAAIASRAGGRSDPAAEQWTTTMLKAQRPDGSWPAEPFAAAPHRGGWVGWYGSSTLTSALCYEALALQANG